VNKGEKEGGLGVAVGGCADELWVLRVILKV